MLGGVGWATPPGSTSWRFRDLFTTLTDLIKVIRSLSALPRRPKETGYGDDAQWSASRTALLGRLRQAVTALPVEGPKAGDLAQRLIDIADYLDMLVNDKVLQRLDEDEHFTRRMLTEHARHVVVAMLNGRQLPVRPILLRGFGTLRALVFRDHPDALRDARDGTAD